MPPLHRQQTRESIYSWWSDNNPTGPNINLHAVAKPLLRRMHDRQALALIRKNRGTPLSSEDLEIYTSYLWSKYISPSTKTAILTEINERADSEEDALTVANSLALYHVDTMLESPNDEFRSQTCLILARLACHATTVAAVLSINPCARLVSILQDDNAEVVENGMYALCCLAARWKGAQALVDAGVLECVGTLLDSGKASIRSQTCTILARLACHATTVAAVLSINPCERLVSILQDDNLEVVESGVYALYCLATWQEGAQALVDAGVLECTETLLGSGKASIRRWTCEMLGRLLQHAPTLPAIADLVVKLFNQLASVLRDEYFHDTALSAMESAARALFSIIRFPEGPQEAILLDCLSDLLESRNFEVRKWTCKMLGDLASYQPTVPMIADPGMKICKRLASILREEAHYGIVLDVMESAAHALFGIIHFSEGPQEAILLDCLSDLLESGNLKVRKWTCEILGRLAYHTPTGPMIAVLVVKLFNQFASLLRDEPFHDTALGAMESSAQALVSSVRFPETPQEEISLDCLLDLLESRNFEVRKFTCEMLGRLACHEYTAMAVLSVNPCPQLVSLLRDTNIEVIQSAAETLSRIATCPEGARTAVNAKVLDWVAEQHGTQNLESPRRMLENVLSHTLDTKHCQQLLSSDLRDNHLKVMTRVLRTLSKIAASPGGALAVVNAKVLDRVAGLFESSNTDVRRWTCQLLGELGSHKRMLVPVFTRSPFNKLVGLLRDDNDEVIESAVCALSWIAALSEAAQAMVDARVLDCTTELLDSQSTDTRRWTCRLLRQLAGHQTTVAAVLAINPCEQLVPRLQDRNVRVVRNSAEALHWIASVPEGAQAALDKDVLQQVMELFTSPEAVVRRWACLVVGQLSSHKTTLPAVLAVKPCTHLVSLLSDEKLVAMEGAVVALYAISRSPEGAEAVVDAHVLDCVAKLLESSSTQVRRWTCQMLAELAQTLAAVVLEVKPCKQLVTLLCDDNIVVVESALYALSSLINSPESAQDALDANLLGSIAKPLTAFSALIAEGHVERLPRLATSADPWRSFGYLRHVA
ncbi:armadillo-type protein [Mycena vulgaris]|nr:armadillo-type protein [Mycena vulgaris]